MSNENNVAIELQICKSNQVRRLEGRDVVISLDHYAVSLHIYECLSVFLSETSSEHMLQNNRVSLSYRVVLYLLNVSLCPDN